MQGPHTAEKIERPKILVTGGAGYIRSHTCKALKSAGYEPVVYDNLSEGHRWAVKWGPLVLGDLSDPDRVRRTLDEFRISAVLDFAAHAYVGESVCNPARALLIALSLPVTRADLKPSMHGHAATAQPGAAKR